MDTQQQARYLLKAYKEGLAGKLIALGKEGSSQEEDLRRELYRMGYAESQNQAHVNLMLDQTFIAAMIKENNEIFREDFKKVVDSMRIKQEEICEGVTK